MKIGLGIGIPFIRNYISSIFDPSKLFTGSTNGVWYDPSDTTTLFQNAAGTTPVTAVEQPVGLMLDKSKGLVLGPELSLNPDFNSSADWFLAGTGWSISSGALVGASPSGFAKIINAGTPQAGKFFKVTITVRSRSSGGVQPRINGSTGTPITGSPNTYSWIVLSGAISGGATDGFQIIGAGPFVGEIESVSFKEIPGNHAFNSSGNSANFPVLSARYNLLTKTEAFDDAAWTKPNAGVSITANASIAPDGTVTADKLVGTNASSTKEMYNSTAVPTAVGSTYKASVYAKAAEYSWVYVVCNVNASLSGTFFNLSTGEIGNTVGSGSTPTIAPAGNGWYQVSSSRSATTGSGYIEIFPAQSNGTGAPNFTGDGTSGIYIWGADLRVANDALNQPAYQRVNTSTDYDTVGFKPYLRFNGTNQWLQTNSIDFTYGDKMFVSAGVRKLSDAAAGVIAELTNIETNVGSFTVQAPYTASGQNYLYGVGTSAGRSQNSLTTYAAPITNVLALSMNMGAATSSDGLSARVNGVQPTSTAIRTLWAATSFANQPLYIGARGGSSLWFNGRLYQMVVAGKQASAAEITSTETYINQKTGAF